MAVQTANKPYFSFVKGIITEASPLTFPEGASIDEANFTLNKDGSRYRRLGLAKEGTKSTESFTDYEWESNLIIAHSWYAPGGDADKAYCVVQFGEKIRLYDMSVSPIDFSDVVYSIDLSSYRPSHGRGGEQGKHPIEVATGQGILYIASRNHTPLQVVYDRENESFTTTEIDIKIRDFNGVKSLDNSDDEMEDTDRLTYITESHRYNLYNQGWTADMISSYFTNKSVYPSNAEAVSYYINEQGTYNYTTDTWKVQPGEFDSEFIQFTEATFGDQQAPRGHFIISAFDKDRDTASGLNAVAPPDNIVEVYRPGAVAFYAGRVWYSGLESTVVPTDPFNENPSSGAVYFSQVLSGDEKKVEYCYQKADPTNKDDPELAATDGGVIYIPEAAKILKLIPLKSGVIVIATNGVWQITGPEGKFTATEYGVNKLSIEGALSAQSVIVGDDFFGFLSKNGIILFTPEQLGAFSAKNISLTTIDSLYRNIEAEAREAMVGIYDRTKQEFKWLYNTETNKNNATYRSRYTDELIFNIPLEAFYHNTYGAISGTSPYVAGYVDAPAIELETDSFDVYVGADAVEDSSDQVVVSIDRKTNTLSGIKYITVCPNGDNTVGIVTCVYSDTNFIDFYAFDNVGVDAAGYLETGYELLGDASRAKAAEYIVTHMLRTETGFTGDGNGNLTAIGASSCKLRMQWNFSDNATSFQHGRVYNASTGLWEDGGFQIYRLKRFYSPTGTGDTFNYGNKVITTKHMVRGSGVALSLRFDTEAGKDCKILGWGIKFTGLTEV